MPEIVLPPRAPEGVTAGAYQVPILAVMLFPRNQDREKRLQWEAAAYAFAYVGWIQSGAPDSFLAGFHPWIARLWTLRQAPEAEMDAGLRRTARAVLSGEILRLLLICAQHHPRHFKVERARALVSHLNQDRKYGASESLISKVWPEFKSVSHLWAAWLSRASSGAGDSLSDEDALVHLTWAEIYRRKAEAVGILRPDEAWSPPESLNLPILDLGLGALGEDELSWLDEQFPL